jgi:H+-transporting ATPase
VRSRGVRPRLRCPPLLTRAAAAHARAGLSSGEASDRLARFGRNALQDPSLSAWHKLALGFATPTSVLLWAAILIEAAEARSARGTGGFWADVCILVALQCLNAYVGWSEERRAAGAVSGLAALLRPEALVRRDGELRRCDSAFLVPGDRVALRGAAAVPADCVLQRGAALQVDASALTGESAPVDLRPGDTARMGTTVLRGEGEAVVTATGAATTFGRTAELVAMQQSPGRLAAALGRILLVLTASAVFFSLLVFAHLISGGEDARHALAFCVVLCCASVPVAMRVVCATTLALGSRQLSSVGAVARRLASVEELAGMDMLCCDKTGTLTAARLALAGDMPTFIPGLSAADLLTAAALATRWWEPPADALDALVLSAVDTAALADYVQVEYFPFDAATRRSEATIQRTDGSLFKVAKGAPQVLLELAGNGPDIRPAVEALVVDAARRGVRCLAVACTHDASGGWVFMGVLTFTDPLRRDAARTLARAAQLGMEVKVLTGDHAAVAAETLRRLGLRGAVLGPESLPPPAHISAHSARNAGRDYGPLALSARCFAGVAPEHKFLLVEALRQAGYTVGFAGDGANDAPALRRADCGVAVAGATDAARAAADLVLTARGLSPLLAAVLGARQIFSRLRVYALYRVAASVQLLGFFTFACLACDPAAADPAWPHYFAIPVVALAVVTILNDATVVSIAYDHAAASAAPERWRLLPLFVVGATLGGVAAVTTSVMLVWGLQAAKDEGPLAGMLGGRDDIYPRLQTAVYLKLTLSNVLTVFAARTQSYCWTRLPSPGLCATACVAACLTSALATNWPARGGMAPIGGGLALLVWLYAILTFAAQDAVKVVVYMFLAEFGQGGVSVEVSPAAMAAMASPVDPWAEEEEEEAEEEVSTYNAAPATVSAHASSTRRANSRASSRDAAGEAGNAAAAAAGGGGSAAEEAGVIGGAPRGKGLAGGAAAAASPDANPLHAPAAASAPRQRSPSTRGGASAPAVAAPRTGSSFERALAGGESWGVLADGAPWLQGFETGMHEDYRTLAAVFDWAALLRGAAPPGGGPTRVLDCGCGCGSFPASLARAGGLDGLTFAVDLLDPSEYALRVAAQRLAPPFAAGTAIHGRLQALDASGAYDVAWAVHSLYAVPRADLRRALTRLRAAVRPGGVVALVHCAREGHLCRFHARLVEHARKHPSPGSARRPHLPHLLAAEDIEAELRAQGVPFRVAEVGHTTAFPADAPQLLEAYLQGCAVAGGAAEAPSLRDMHAAPGVGQYIRAMRDWERTQYYFAQRVKLIIIAV